jgi:hypothetical protein
LLQHAREIVQAGMPAGVSATPIRLGVAIMVGAEQTALMDCLQKRSVLNAVHALTTL